MHRHRKPSTGRVYRETSLLNSLLLKFGSLNPLTFKEFPMTSRRNVLIRTVATVVGDIAVAMAFASACIWLIEFATLGLFLSFLVWLIAALLAMAASQYLVHPTVTLLLSDRKLDRAIEAMSSMTELVSKSGLQGAFHLWSKFKPAA